MAQTRVGHELSSVTPGARAGVSLHSHSHHSHENLGFLPGWLAGVPAVGRLARIELARQQRRLGCALRFDRAYWCPPMPPLAVVTSEETQIAQRLQLQPLVSVTDHDSIDAHAALAALGHATRSAVSLEWTVPYHGQVFHLGIHNLPAATAVEWVGRFHGYTVAPSDAGLAGLLAELSALRPVLIVLNHPLWNAHVDARAERSVLASFVQAYRPFLHATEVNGYRSHAENRAALLFGRAWNLPVVAGGDRHGRAPNAMLNVTAASSFDEFVDDVRRRGHSDIVIMPEYRDHPAARVAEVVADVVGTHAGLEPGQRRWFQRVFIIDDEGRHRPLEHYWHDVPRWVRVFIGTLSRVGCGTARQAIRLGLPVENGGVL